MSKYTLSILFALLISIVSNSQWPLFNEAHPVSCQSPAFNYRPHGHFGNVLIVDTVPNYYDGYLVFGKGVISHPDSVANYGRTFSAKCNVDGEVVWWRRYDEDGEDINQQWYNLFFGDRGGIFRNWNGDIVSMSMEYVYGDPANIYSRNYLLNMDIHGQITQSYLVDSSADSYFFLGLTEDKRDSTYIGFGYLQDSLSIINLTEPDAFILKMDSMGNHIWQRTFPNTFTVQPKGIYQAFDGGFWLVCNKKSGFYCVDNFNINTDLVIIKTDSLGVEESRFEMGGYCGDDLTYIYEYAMDKIVLGGRLTDSLPGEFVYQGYLYTAFMEQLPNDQLSQPTELKRYFHSAGGLPADFHHLQNDQYLMVGDQYFDDLGGDSLSRFGFILKLDENRDSVWCRRYSHYQEVWNGDIDMDATNNILDSKVMDDGGIVCVGMIRQGLDNPNPFLETPWIFRVDSLGCLEPGCQFVDVQEVVVGLQNTMSIYPNPATDMVHINFELSPHFHTLHSKLVVINLQGQTVLEKELSPSAFIAPVDLNITDLAAGHYTVHWVSDGAWLDSVKMIKW